MNHTFYEEDGIQANTFSGGVRGLCVQITGDGYLQLTAEQARKLCQAILEELKVKK